MKVALVGNSHLGRIKKEWDAWCRRQTGVEHAYFIHRSMGTHPLRIRGEGEIAVFPDICLIEDEVLDPTRFDAVVVVGMSLGVQRVFEFGHRFRCPGMPAEGGYLLTRSTWHGALDDMLANTDAVRIVQALGTARSRPRILIMPQPHPMEWLNTRSDFRMAWSEWAHEHHVEEFYLAAYEASLGRLAGALDVEVVTQPAETVASGIWTRSEYGLAQEGDPSNQYWPKNDYFHSNDAFARRLAPRLFDLLIGTNADAGSAVRTL